MQFLQDHDRTWLSMWLQNTTSRSLNNDLACLVNFPNAFVLETEQDMSFVHGRNQFKTITYNPTPRKNKLSAKVKYVTSI